MLYNVFISQGSYNQKIRAITEEELSKIVEAYRLGYEAVKLPGRKINIYDPDVLRIFTIQAFADLNRYTVEQKITDYCINNFGSQMGVPLFLHLGEEVTDIHLKEGWGSDKSETETRLESYVFDWSIIHPQIMKVAKTRFDSKNFADAVEASFKEVNDIIKIEFKTKMGSELDGAPLMQKVFSANNAVFPLVDQSTQSGRDLQLGYMQIFTGSMSGIRNPKAHKNLTIDVIDAWEKIILASHLSKMWDNRTK